MAFLFYVDESGNSDLKGKGLNDQPFLVMAAVGIQDRMWHAMEQSFLEFARRLGVATAGGAGSEVKGREVYRNPTLPAALTDLLRSVDPIIIACVIDKPAFANQNAFPDPYVKAHEFLVERIDRWAEERNEIAMIVMDSRGGDEDRMRRLHRHFLTHGTSYQRIRFCIEQPFFVDSRLTTGVQIADVAAYIIGRAIREAVQMHRDGQDPRSAFLDARFASLAPYLRKVQGEVDRYGLKIWPEDRWRWIRPLIRDVLSGPAGMPEEEIPF
jgi:hypothetical protein